MVAVTSPRTRLLWIVVLASGAGCGARAPAQAVGRREAPLVATFAAARSVSLGPSRPVGLVTNDFDGDGRTDVVITAEADDVVTTWTGVGAGLLEGPTSAAGRGPHAAASGDLDGDGIVDLVTVDAAGHAATTLLGLGDGSFAPPRRLDLGFAAHALVLADFDGDGRLDLAVAGRDSASGGAGVRVYAGIGDGGFLLRSAPETRAVVSIAAADVDGDGRLDLLAVDGRQTSGNELWQLLGKGDGSFLAAAPLPTGLSLVRRVAAADLDGDGLLDVVASGSAVAVMRGLGAGQLAAPVSYPSSEREVTAPGIADVDGDGVLDMVSVSRTQVGSQSWRYALELFRGNGDATFAPRVVTPFGGAFIYDAPTGSLLSDFAELALADLDGDGLLDAGVAAGRLYLIGGVGDGSFRAPIDETGARGCAPGAVLAGDVDGDGLADAVVLCGDRSNVRTLVGQADGSLAPPIVAAAGSDLAGLPALRLADVDGDGRADLVSFNRELDVRLGQADGTFAAAQKNALPFGKGHLALGDFDGDGHLDALLDHDSYSLALLHGAGDGTFGAAAPVTSAGVWQLEAADVDGDGRLDAVLVDTSRRLIVLRGKGDGTFSAPQVTKLGAQQALVWMALGDVNGDGRLDVAWRAGKDTLGVAIGLGDGAFDLLPLAAGRVDAAGRAITLLDADGDGRLDLVATTGAQVSVHAGNGDGTFGPALLLDSGGPGIFSLAATPLGASTRPDLLVVDRSYDRLRTIHDTSP